LRPHELDAALVTALSGFSAGGGRAFCADRAGSGTTLLVAAPRVRLDPRVGVGSAAEHAGSGARRLTGPWPSLACDVDTPDDLAEAARLGLGGHTAALLAEIRP
ncbi:MAG TPA: 2-phospho-L-lactate guanylyltransferase, partial [Pseudonocardiaceae bacterium]